MYMRNPRDLLSLWFILLTPHTIKVASPPIINKIANNKI